MPTGLITAAETVCPQASQQPGRMTVIVPAALIISVIMVSLSTRAEAAEPGLELSTDALSASLQDGASHVLISIDNPAAIFATHNTAATDTASNMAIDMPHASGFDPAYVDPATVNFGGVLQTGTASWYGVAWRGRRTASGARFDPEALTAASRTLPLGTRVLVTLEGSLRSVLVTITDRQGAAQRVIDLSRAAARKLGLLGRGTARVVLRRA